MAKDITLKTRNGETRYPKSVTDLIFENGTGKTLQTIITELRQVDSDTDTRTRMFKADVTNLDTLNKKTDIGLYNYVGNGWRGAVSINYDSADNVSQVALSSSTPSYNGNTLTWLSAQPCAMARTYTNGAWSHWEKVGAPVVNDLTTGGTDKALSAEMGKTLKEGLDALGPKCDQNTTNIENLQQEIDAITPIIIEGDVTNAPDEEDLTMVNNVIKFKGRSTAVNQKGYKILRKGTSLASQMTDANTIYEVRYNFDLGGNKTEVQATCNDESVLSYDGSTKYLDSTPITINSGEGVILRSGQYLINSAKTRVLFSRAGYFYGYSGTFYIGLDEQGDTTFIKSTPLVVPENSVLKFVGGSFSNGVIYGNGSIVLADDDKIFNNIEIEGRWACRGNIGWWASGSMSTNVDESSNIQLALDSAFLEMNCPAKAIYLGQTVKLRRPKILFLAGPSDETSLNAYNYHGNNDATLFYTDQNIPLLSIQPISFGWAGARSGSIVKIHGGVFDVSRCDSFDTCAVEITTLGGLISNLEIDSLVVGRRMSGPTSERQGVGVFVHTQNGYMTNVHINTNILWFNTGLKAERGEGVDNWFTDLYFDGYISACTTAVDSSVSINMAGTIQSGYDFTQDNKGSFPLVKLNGNEAYVSTKIWDVDTSTGGNYTNAVAISLGDNTRLYLGGESEQWGEPTSYRYINGIRGNIYGYNDSYSFSSRNPYAAPIVGREDSAYDYFRHFLSYKGSVSVHHYDSEGVEKGAVSVSNAHKMFEYTRFASSLPTAQLSSTFEEGDYVDIVCRLNAPVSIVKMVYYLDNTLFDSVQLVVSDSSGTNPTTRTEVSNVTQTANDNVVPVVFVRPSNRNVYDTYTIRLFGLKSQTFDMGKIRGFALYNRNANPSDGLEYNGTTLTFVPAIERGNSNKWNFISQRDWVLSNNINTLFEVRMTGNPTMNSYLVYAAGYRNPASSQILLHALYRFDFYGNSNSVIRYKVEKLSGNLDLTPIIYSKDNTVNVFRFGVKVETSVNTYGVFVNLLNPDGNVFSCENSQTGFTSKSVTEVKNYGSYANAPTEINVGFQYFCTSGASIDGGTTEKTNIVIYYIGSGWVDANGNAVVATT